MSKLINTILLSTTLLMMSCSNSHSTMIYNPLYDLNGDIITNTKYKIDSVISSSHFGQIYFQESPTSDKLYLEDEDGRPFFDLGVVASSSNATSQPIRNLLEAGGGNIIVKTNASGKYTLANPLTLTGNTNLIIPKGITLTKADSTDASTPLNILFESGCNNTLLVMGNIQAMNDKGWWSVVDFGKYNAICESDGTTVKQSQSAIAMPNAKIILAGGSVCTQDPDSQYGCSFAGSNVCDIKIVMYPGVTLKHDMYNTKNKSNSIAAFGNLYLNRFCETTSSYNKNLLDAKVSESMHVIYPSYEKGKLRTTNIKDGSNTGNYTYTSDFINLHFTGAFDNKKVDVNYSFEDAKAPLSFNFNQEKNKLILGFNPENELAKYDAKLWNECGLNDGKYSLNYYNKLANKGNYINVDEAYKLFYGVTKDQKEVELKTNTIYFGLIGSNDKEIKLDLTNIESKDTVYFYGDNSEYEGSIVVPETITKINFGQNSLRYITRTSDTSTSPLYDVTFYLLGNNKLDLAKYDANTTHLFMNLDNTTYTESSGTLEIIDSNNTKTTIGLYGDYSKYEGKIKIPNNITSIQLKSSDPFFKIKHCDNEDLSKLTYVLTEDLTLDLKNINNSTFEMNLSNAYNKSNYSSIKLIDSSNPTKITKVIFSGDNTNYKEKSDADNNTGIVELTPYIKEVEFINTPKSFVNLIAFNTTRTVLVNNVLSLETSKIKVIPADYSETITYNTIEKRDSINNIEKYNKPGIIWDTNTLKDCFVDGKNLLKHFPINMIKADLKGSKDITIQTADNIITLLGNNTEYTGTITIPENVTDIFLRRISKITNIVHTEDDELNKLHFHYEEIKPEVKSNNFCVPFDNVKKVNGDNKYKLSKAEELIAKLSKENDENKYKLSEARKYIYYINKRNTSPKHNKYFDEYNINNRFDQHKSEKYSDKNVKYFNEFDKYNSREYSDKNSRYESFYKNNVSPKYKKKYFDDFKEEQNKFEKYEEHHNKYLKEDNKYDDRDYEYKPRRKHYNSLYNLDNLYEVNIDDDELSGDYTYEFCKDGTVTRYKKDI